MFDCVTLEKSIKLCLMQTELFVYRCRKIQSQKKMTTAQVVETLVTVSNNSPIQDYVHPNDQTQPTFEMTRGSNLSQRLRLLAEVKEE